MNADQVAPLLLIISLAIVCVFFLHYRHRTRSEVQETIRSALSNGAQLTPELVQVLGEPAAPKHGDLRRGVILICIGAALFVSGVFAGLFGEDQGGAVFFMVISTFPFLVGLAYLLLWKWTCANLDE